MTTLYLCSTISFNYQLKVVPLSQPPYQCKPFVNLYTNFLVAIVSEFVKHFFSVPQLSQNKKLMHTLLLFYFLFAYAINIAPFGGRGR